MATSDRKRGRWQRLVGPVVLFVGLLLLGLFFALRWLVGVWLGDSVLLGDRVGMASVLVMQIDSFLVAGYVVGFFQFQGGMSKMIREFAGLKAEVSSAFSGSGSSARYFVGRRFVLLMMPIGFFVLSGMYAVRASLFQDRGELVASLALLSQGTIFMVVFWFALINDTESMAARIGKVGGKSS